MEEREEKKGFTIRDRRASAQPEESLRQEGEGGPRREPHMGEHRLAEISFSSFILSLSTSALLQLGEVPDPSSGTRAKDLPMAKQTIDLLGMLKEKTRGNLTSEEDQLLEHLLADLRWRYVRESREG